MTETNPQYPDIADSTSRLNRPKGQFREEEKIYLEIMWSRRENNSCQLCRSSLVFAFIVVRPKF